MLGPVALDRSYDPALLAAMNEAFEKICHSVSSQMNGNDDVRKAVALAILKYTDLGETDPARLSELALKHLMGQDRDRSKLGVR